MTDRTTSAFMQRQGQASRIYPQRRDSLGLELFARKGRVSVRSLDFWHLASIWNL